MEENKENMSVEDKAEKRVKVIDTFSSDPRSQNWYGKPAGQYYESRGKKGSDNLPWVVGGLAAFAISALAAVGLRTGVDQQQPESAPSILSVEDLDQMGPRVYTGEIVVKIDQSLNIRQHPRIIENYGGLPNVILWKDIQTINGAEINGAVGLRLTNALIIKGEAVEGSHNWISGLDITDKKGERMQGFISMSPSTEEFVQKDNFGKMVPAPVENNKVINSLRVEPIKSGPQR
jgi:hypothetical protein